MSLDQQQVEKSKGAVIGQEGKFRMWEGEQRERYYPYNIIIYYLCIFRCFYFLYYYCLIYC